MDILGPAKFKVEIKDDEIVLSRYGKCWVFGGFKHLFVEYKGIQCLYMYEGNIDMLKFKTLGIKLSKHTELASVLLGNFEIAHDSRALVEYYILRHINLGV